MALAVNAEADPYMMYYNYPSSYYTYPSSYYYPSNNYYYSSPYVYRHRRDAEAEADPQYYIK